MLSLWCCHCCLARSQVWDVHMWMDVVCHSCRAHMADCSSPKKSGSENPDGSATCPRKLEEIRDCTWQCRHVCWSIPDRPNILEISLEEKKNRKENVYFLEENTNTREKWKGWEFSSVIPCDERFPLREKRERAISDLESTHEWQCQPHPTTCCQSIYEWQHKYHGSSALPSRCTW